MHSCRISRAVAVLGMMLSGCVHHDEPPPSLAVTVKHIDAQGRAITEPEVRATSGQLVDFRYEICNKTRTAINGLQLRTACNCQIGDPPPAILAAGESACFTLRLQAPAFGTIVRRVELGAAGDPTPIAVVEMAANVPISPPLHLRPSDSIVLKYVRGDSASRDVTFETIESRGSENWIREIKIPPDTLVEAEPMTAEERPEQDPTLVRRTYRLPLFASKLPPGTTRLTAVPCYRAEPPTKQFDVDVYVEVMGRLGVYPKRLALTPAGSTGAKEEKFVVVQRGDPRDVTVKPQDESLLTLHLDIDDEGRTRAVGVQPTPAFVPGSRTVITFVAGDDVEEAEVELVSPPTS